MNRGATINLQVLHLLEGKDNVIKTSRDTSCYKCHNMARVGRKSYKKINRLFFFGANCVPVLHFIAKNSH